MFIDGLLQLLPDVMTGETFIDEEKYSVSPFRMLCMTLSFFQRAQGNQEGIGALARDTGAKVAYNNRLARR